jgi:hypothetical protein
MHGIMLRIQRDNRDFFGSVGQLAEYFDADDRPIRNQLHAMRDMGFVEEIESRAGNSVIYRAVSHPDWTKKYGEERCCIKREREANPSHKMGVPTDSPLPLNGIPPSHKMGEDPSHKMHLPLPLNGIQVSEVVSEAVAVQFPKGSSGRENPALSLSNSSNPKPAAMGTPESSEPEKTIPSRKRDWLRRIWHNTNSEPLNVRNTDTHRLERFITEHGEEKTARAWFTWVNAEPRPYHMDAPTLSVKKRGKNGSEWLEQTEDDSQITRFPLASFFSSPEGFMETPWSRFTEERFAKQFEHQARERVAA